MSAKKKPAAAPVQWAVVCILLTAMDKRVWRLFRKYDSLRIASAACDSEPECQVAHDTTILTAGNLKNLAGSDLDEVLRGIGQINPSGTEEEKRQLLVSHIDTLEAHASLTDAGLAASFKEPKPKTDASASSEDQVATKKTPAKTAKKTTKKQVKAKQPKAHAKLEQQGDGLGREGTPARFIRERYLKGQDTATILEAVKKAFPKNDIKGPGYVSWYQRDMRLRGLLKDKK